MRIFKKRVYLLLIATLVLVTTALTHDLAIAQTQNNKKLQTLSIADIDADSVTHLLQTPLLDLEGKEQRISDYQDKIILLNFWASWCAPCVEEMPDLEELNRDFDNVQVIGYSVDTEQNIRQFLEKVPVNFPILIGEATSISLMRKLGNPTGGLPFTMIFDVDAELGYKVIGQVNIEEIKAKLEEIGA